MNDGSNLNVVKKRSNGEINGDNNATTTMPPTKKAINCDNILAAFKLPLIRNTPPITENILKLDE
jgi:hypothetical protein